MARATWNIDVNGQQHLVDLKWSYFGGEREVIVDSRVANDNTIPFRWTSEQKFTIDGQEGRVVTGPQRINIAAFAVEPSR